MGNRMQEPINPFTPNFGETPVYMAGRDYILGDFRNALAREIRSPELTTLISGARGTGKTALINKIADYALNNGWIIVKTVSGPGMLEDILQHAMRDAQNLIAGEKDKPTLTGLGLGQLLSLEWNPGVKQVGNWRIQIEELLDQLEQQGSGLLIAVDEINASHKEMIQLAQVYQLLVMDNRRIGLIMAGLPYNIEQAKGTGEISFLRRAQQRVLERIEDAEVAYAIEQTVRSGGRTIEREALDAAVSAALGFPYMIQLVGYRMWEQNPTSDTITLEDANKGIKVALREMRVSVLESTYRELSDGDLLFLQAMLEDEKVSSIADITRRLDKSTGYIGTYKSRLLQSGVIGEWNRKYLRFNLPGFKEFLIQKLTETP